jgi:acyl-coenzyme A synthetase/AMP-(fatty) acid ligase
VRLRRDGLLQVIGRRDRQVKIRGLRVEPAEIEDALRRVSGVADTAVVARHDGEDTSLLAFIVAVDAADTALLDRVRAAVAVGLPNHMHPARVLVVDRLPLLPGGKVDVRALLTIEAAAPRETRFVSFWSLAAVRADHAFAHARVRAWWRALARIRWLARR